MSNVHEVELPEDAGHTLRGKKVKARKGKSRKKSDPLVSNITQLISSSLTFVSPDKLTNTSPKTDTLQQKTLEGFLTKGITTNGNDYCAGNNQSDCKQLTGNMSEIKTLNFEVKNNVGEEEYKNSCESPINNVDFNKKHSDEMLTTTPGKRYKIKRKSGLSLRGSNGVYKNSSMRALNESDEVLNVDEDSNKCSTEKKESRNAFEFMMEVRNRSIGQNSSGKDAQLVQNDVSYADKQKLAARRVVFENWANKKGGLKRKIEEEEKDALIEHKLKLRARRLKKLLKINTENNRIETVKTRKQRKIVKRVCAHSEDSIDCHTNESNEIREDADLKCNFSSKHVKEDLIEDSVNSSNYKKTLHQKELSNFFKVVEGMETKLEIIGCRNSSDTDEGNLNTIKIKMFSPGVFKRRRKRTSHNEECGGNVKLLCEDEKVENISISSDEELKPDDDKHKFVGNTKQFEIREKKSNKNGKIVTARNVDVTCPSGNKNKDNCECHDTRKSIQANKSKLKNTTRDKLISKTKSTASVSDEIAHKMTQVDNNYTNNQSHRRSARQMARIKKNTPIFEIDSDSDEPSNLIVKTKKTFKIQKKTQELIKVAPIFTNIKKRKNDSQVVNEARKNFLLSGVPETLKKIAEKHKRVDELRYNIFPQVSHVQQKHEHGAPFWNLPNANLKLKNIVAYIPTSECLSLGSFTDTSPQTNTLSIHNDQSVTVESILQEIKANNPKYPINRCYRLLKQKCNNGKADVLEPNETHVNQTSKRGKKKIIKKQHDDDDAQKNSCGKCGNSLTWTEKYKPNNCDDFIGNRSKCVKLKKWLSTWMACNNDVTQTTKHKRAERDSSGSDFECDDREGCDGNVGNAVVLTGPHGTGKTACVYAVCNEFGINVIELNASSKRTGKRLLQELQEATQSHQVRKSDTNNIPSPVRRHKSSRSIQKERRPLDESCNKICLLLIEDVDVVFDQDEGFLSALTQLLAISKRPVILTTTDEKCPFLQKFLYRCPIIRFLPLSAEVNVPWLRILCTLEGLHVTGENLTELLERKKGDMRKTLLQLQFSIESHVRAPNARNCKDGISVNGETRAACTTRECLDNRMCSTPFAFDLQTVWWNLPVILDKSLPQHNFCGATLTESTKLANMCETFERMSVVDGARHNTKLEFRGSGDKCKFSDSLELGENLQEYDDVCEFTETWTNYFLEKTIGEECKLIAVTPPPDKTSWINRQEECKSAFKTILPLSRQIEREAVSLDYYPILREMSRSENLRFHTNSKRGNRFYNYLRTLGFKYSPYLNKTISDTMKVDVLI